MNPSQTNYPAAYIRFQSMESKNGKPHGSTCQLHASRLHLEAVYAPCEVAGGHCLGSTNARLEFQFQMGTHYILENPVNSLLFSHPAIKEFNFLAKQLKPCASKPRPRIFCQDRLRAHNATFVNVCLGAFGAPTRKCATLLRANTAG